MCTLTLSLPAVLEADDRRAWYFSLDGEAAALILRTCCNTQRTQRTPTYDTIGNMCSRYVADFSECVVP